MKLFIAFCVVFLAAVCAGDIAEALREAESNAPCPGPNEQRLVCGTACEPSCEIPEYNFCTKQCLVNVCQCKKGFVRGPNGCIQHKDCRKN